MCTAGGKTVMNNDVQREMHTVHLGGCDPKHEFQPGYSQAYLQLDYLISLYKDTGIFKPHRLCSLHKWVRCCSYALMWECHCGFASLYEDHCLPRCTSPGSLHGWCLRILQASAEVSSIQGGLCWPTTMQVSHLFSLTELFLCPCHNLCFFVVPFRLTSHKNRDPFSLSTVCGALRCPTNICWMSDWAD